MLSDIVSRIFHNFDSLGWPKSIVISGTNSSSKENYILETLSDVLSMSSYKDSSKKQILQLIKEEAYPDLYIFPKDKIKIGNSDRSEIGTIRHLLKTFIPYAPKTGRRRFVYFPDASAIGDEAESALLKVLEEPPPNTHFILSIEAKELLKETIASRCIEVPYRDIIEPNLVSPEPWDRFWYLSGYKQTYEYNLIYNNDWISVLKKNYDILEFTYNDYTTFENIGVSEVKKFFPKETVEVQSNILYLSFLPLYYSIRDGLIEGMVPSMGPIRIPIRSKKKVAIKIEDVFQLFFKNLQTRYYGTRVPNTSIIFYEFIAELLPLWNFKEAP